MSVLAMQANASLEAIKRLTIFNTDLEIVGVDNRCTGGCISHVKEDIVGNLEKCNRVIKEFRGTRAIGVMTSTIRWKCKDDQGIVHMFDIPGFYCISDG